ncbi:MAG: chondroitinase-B domain-containing protein [Bacteroidota bacterium]
MRNIMLMIGLLLSAFAGRTETVYQVNNPETFNKALEKAVPGDQIVIANGRYSGWEMTVNTNGSAGQPITIRAETTGKVTFSGTVSRSMFKLTGSYTEIAGLAFVDCELLRATNAAGVLIELKDSKYCRIRDCFFSRNKVGTQYMPIVVVIGKGEHNRVDHCLFAENVDNQEIQIKVTESVAPLYTLIDHNVFQDKKMVSWKGGNGGECVQVGQDPVLLGTKEAKAIVRANRFIRCNGEAEVISNKSSGNQYIGNYFEDCQGELVMRGGHDCLIDSNVFKGGSGGIRVNGSHHVLSNNSISGVRTGIRLMYGMASGKDAIGFYVAASDCLIKNNRIDSVETGILIGDGKDADWKGKFDTKKYPSPTQQDVSPFNIVLLGNNITAAKVPVLHRER